MGQSRFIYIATAAMGFVCVVVAAISLIRTGQPSADVRARIDETYPTIQVSDYEPGFVGVLNLNGTPVIVWRRNAEDMALAKAQNDPSEWHNQYNQVFGENEPVFADDANLTLNGEWFFALAYVPTSPFIVTPRMGNFDGFFEMKWAGHYDLAGRARFQAHENLTIIRGMLSEDGQEIHLYMGPF